MRDNSVSGDFSALVDLEVVKSIIVNEISNAENDAFREWFSTLFPNSEAGSLFSAEDKLAEIKAFMIIVALAMMNVPDSLVFVKVLLKDVFFQEAYRGMGAILYGIAASEVS